MSMTGLEVGEGFDEAFSTRSNITKDAIDNIPCCVGREYCRAKSMVEETRRED